MHKQKNAYTYIHQIKSSRSPFSLFKSESTQRTTIKVFARKEKKKICTVEFNMTKQQQQQHKKWNKIHC